MGRRRLANSPLSRGKVYCLTYQVLIQERSEDCLHIMAPGQAGPGAASCRSLEPLGERSPTIPAPTSGGLSERDSSATLVTEEPIR